MLFGHRGDDHVGSIGEAIKYADCEPMIGRSRSQKDHGKEVDEGTTA